VAEGEIDAQSFDYLAKTIARNSLVRYMEFFVTDNAFGLLVNTPLTEDSK
jgi:hypothetical protein